MISCIIIDDEKHSRKILELSIKKYCPDVSILTVCRSGEEGLEAIRAYHPDLVFLDIEMPKMSGFDMLEKLETIDFDIIFTTAFEEYALKAFKVDAIDYLLKPIEEKELIKAIQKVKERKAISEEQIDMLMDQIKKNVDSSIKKIPVPSSIGLEFLDVNEIIYCKSESNYTFIILTNKKKKVLAKTLKYFDELLPKNIFFRCHHSYIINLNHIKTYVKSDGGYIIMSNGDHVGISRHKKEAFLNKF